MALSMSHSTPDGVWRWVDNSWELIGIEGADATAFAKYCREKNQLQVGEIVLSDVSLPPDGYYVFEKFKWIKKTEWKPLGTQQSVSIWASYSDSRSAMSALVKAASISSTLSSAIPNVFASVARSFRSVGVTIPSFIASENASR